ncbi:MAG: hypothetical protein R3344_15740, partial [Acidobacteriota bacterium]|nr:hypothetical protein [Acidobacteriota bacterium]
AGPALDLTAGKLYWTEDGSNRIRRANLDGTGVQNLVTTGLGGPFGIAVDPAGKMYWTDYQTRKIQRANLDGTGVEDLVTTGLLAPRGITLDLGAGKMYWVDYDTSKLSRANLDGTGVEDVLTNLGAPNAVALGCNVSPLLAPTAVELTSFTATAADSAVVLEWETGAELNNLGFHLYRSESADGPFERVTVELIPGLGSSPAGARYRHVDTGLVNGVTYHYELEDVETTGATERHGPVAATPDPSAPRVDESGEDDDTSSHITYGDPEASSLRVIPRKRGVVLELETGGFAAVPQEDGTVRLVVPGLEEYQTPLPAKRIWVDALAGRNVDIVSVRAVDVTAFDGLRPTSA